MACDEFAETIHDLAVQMADAGLIQNMDQAAAEFEKVGVDRQTLATALVEVAAFRASQNIKKTITNIAEVKADARLEKSLVAQLERLENELAHMPVDAPVTPKKRKRINKEIGRLRTEIAKVREKLKTQKHHERRLEQVGKGIERLDAKIAELETIVGDFSTVPPAQRPPEAKEIEDLKEKRTELAREKDLIEQIKRLEQGKTAAVPTTPSTVTNSRIADLVNRRDQLARQKQLEDQIDDLQQKLQTTEYEIPMNKEAKEATDVLEDAVFRRNVLRKQVQSHIQSLKPVSRVKIGLDNTFGVYKAMRAAIDWSMVLRQGLRYVVSHPIKTIMEVPGTFEAMISPKFAAEQVAEFEQHPLYKDMVNSGLEITDTETNREDEFSQLAIKNWILKPIFHGKASPFAASERAFSHFMNQVRVDSFATLYKSINPNGEVSLEDGKAIARFVNILTGRGDPGKAAMAGDLLNYIFFSYRYTLSNIQFMEDLFVRAPQEMWTKKGTSWAPTDLVNKLGELSEPSKRRFGSEAARKVILKEYARIGAGYGAAISLVALWNMIHMDEDDDFLAFFNPMSTDFMKMRVGDRRIDVLGGLGQVVVFGARMMRGYYTDSEGERQYFSEPGGRSRRQIMGDQFFNKLHPLLGATWDYAEGETRFGEMETRDTEGSILNPANVNLKWVVNEFMPVWSALSVQEGVEIINDEELSHEGWMYIGFCLGLGILGAGSYNPETAKDAEEEWYDFQNPHKY